MRDLDQHCRSPIEILLIGNHPEDAELASLRSSHTVSLQMNSSPKGFAANQNAAFDRSAGPFFCVLNPDVRLRDDPFPALAGYIANPEIGLVAPLVVSTNGTIQQSFRDVMSPWMLARRAVGLDRNSPFIAAPHVFPEWIAGMFMLFRREVFAELQGFDERYFLYCEDMELCCRVWLSGRKVAIHGGAAVLHDGQYASRKSLKYLLLHLRSLLRFWRSRTYVEFRKRFRKH